MVFGLYFFLRRFFRGAELGGAFIAASTVAILGFARGGETDMSLAACFTLAMLAWLAWHGNGEKKFLAGFYFFLAAATLAKGPVAPLLAGLIIAIFAAAQREFRIVARTLWWPGLLLFAAVAAPWYVLVQARNPQFPDVPTVQIEVSYPVRFSSTTTRVKAAREPSGESCGVAIQVKSNRSFSVMARLPD